MKYKVKAQYSKELIKKTTFKYLIKSLGISFYGAASISLAIALYLFFSGNRSILLPVFCTVSVFSVLIFFRLYSHYYNGANKEFKKLEGESAWITIKENGISFTTDSDSLKWKDLHKVWSTKEAYLFFTAKDSFIICPTAGFDEEQISFINAKLEEFRIKH